MFKKLMIAAALLTSCSVLAQQKAPPKPFTLDGKFGFNSTSGNTDTTAINGGLKAKHRLKKWENDYIFEALYQEATAEIDGVEETEATAQRFFASAQGNYKLSNPDYRLFVFGSYEDNAFGAFDYQGTAALGWNHKLWDNGTTNFEYSIGPGYTFQRDQEPNDPAELQETNKFFVVRGSAEFEWLISETAKFTQTLAVESGSENTQTTSQSALTAKISGAFSVNVAFRLVNNSSVNEGRENTDTETAVTLVYSFF
jgi:putative salt-induced outer membrane protein YdiY